MAKTAAATQSSGKGKNYILALDAGGTMTDTILVKPDGDFTIGKSLTNRKNEASSYLESVEDAALALGLKSKDVHEQASVAIYAGTGMLNTLLTGTGRKVGLLVTRGFEHASVMEGGLTYLGQTQAEILHQQLHEHTRPMVDPRNIVGISERICGGSYFMQSHMGAGELMIPVNEAHVRKGVERLLASGVDVIGIMFLNSYVNPDNENAARRIAEDVVKKSGRAIPVVCSADVAPVSRENNRLKSLLIQCFAAELTREALLGVENAAIKEGYDGRLLTLLSYGGAVNMNYPRLYETIISGPIGGLMGAQIFADKLGIKNAITADMGGTSFDVGLLVNGMLGIRKDADFAGHRLALPMVAIDSAGSGAGSAIEVDAYKRLRVGPESAGADVGICYKYDRLTVTDVNVVLGYVDPDYFLGGKVKLDKDRAYAELERVIAKPLGLDVYEAGSGVLEVINTQMRDLASTMITSKGYNPRDFTMLCYGGAGPVHMWGYSDGIDLANVITFPWAAGFSAFGAACAEYMHRYHRGSVELVPNGMGEAEKTEMAKRLDAAFRGLEEAARGEMAQEGVDPKQLTFRYGAYARYLGQLESFDTPLDFGALKSAEDVDRVVAAFEEMYTNIYPEGARFPDAGYSITELYIQAVAPKPQPAIIEHPMSDAKPSSSAYVETRKVFHKGVWMDFQVWQMEALAAGNVVEGPAIIRDPMTTVVIPPGKRVEFDKYRVLHYR